MANEVFSEGAGLKLTAGEFRQISDLAYQRFGLDLKRGKEALVAARLGKKLRQLGFQSFAEYHRHVLADGSGDALVELIDALTTNHTSFLRERAHFEFLARAANEEFRDVATLRVWSAACSSGEEPYSIAMCLAESFKKDTLNSRSREFRILATDISTRVLASAQQRHLPGRALRGSAGRLAPRLSAARPGRIGGVLQGETGTGATDRVRSAQFDRAVFATRIVSRDLLPQRHDVFRQADPAGYRAAAERASGTGRLSFCGSFRVTDRRRARFALRAPGYLSQSKAGGRIEDSAVKSSWR